MIKKKLSVIFSVLLAAVAMVAAVVLTACGGSSKAELVMKGESLYVVKANATEGTLYEGLTELMQNKEFSTLKFVTSTEDETEITEIDGVTATWEIYTTLTEYDGVTYTSSSAKITVSDVTYYMATVDCKHLPLVEGYRYLINKV